MIDTEEQEYTKLDLVRELEGYGDNVVDPDEFTWQELADDLRYKRCCNCVAYENKDGCDKCTKQILEAEDFLPAEF